MDNTESNKLIAEFMRWEEPTEWSAIAPKSGGDCWQYEDMKFNASWDWLMPVVRKIVEVSCDEDENAFLSDQYTSILETVPLAIIEDAYKVVVEFIEWHNKQK